MPKEEMEYSLVVKANLAVCERNDPLAAGLSIMPEGIEKDLSRKQIADLIAYLLSVK